MRFLLDTHICIYLINRKPAQVVQRFRRFPLGEIGISSITAAELAFGVTKSGSARNRSALEKFLAPLEIAPFTADAIWHYGGARAVLERADTPIGALNTLIAAQAQAQAQAQALALDVTVVSNNLKEFQRVDGLRWENWVQDPIPNH